MEAEVAKAVARAVSLDTPLFLEFFRQAFVHIAAWLSKLVSSLDVSYIEAKN
jgi:hypothetical protein